MKCSLFPSCIFYSARYSQDKFDHCSCSQKKQKKQKTTTTKKNKKKDAVLANARKYHSIPLLNTRRRPRILGEEPNINDELHPREISGSRWDSKRFHRYLARVCDVYWHCFSRKHEPQNRLICDLFFTFSFLCILRVNFSKSLFIVAKIIKTNVFRYSAKNIRFQ